ncbi:MAG: tetratricopeptide repeat protein [Deltaproteobacteria bacterium]|nr:tetratricopeptide repeat protein [Deltaproteobacteria bacterium]
MSLRQAARACSPPRAPLRGTCLGLLVLAAASFPDGVLAQDLEQLDTQLTRVERDADTLIREFRSGRRQFQSRTHVEERLTDGELFYRLRDYLRASIIFTDIVENYPNHQAYPDALFLLGDSRFLDGDYYGARSRFRQLLDQSDRPGFRPFVQRALGRLIEVAIHTRDFDGVEGYFERLNRIPPQEIEAATNYVRAKYLFSLAAPPVEQREAGQGAIDPAGLERALQAFSAVGQRSPYYPQARYFIGVIYTLQERYPQAIEAFRRVSSAPAETTEQREVLDLTWLALGRLYYETDQSERAIESYQRVSRRSRYFDTALYEIAWVFIRMGDSTRAERALEVLSIANPDSLHIPDAKILRGNLLLRNGQFDAATRVFREVIREFGPVRVTLDRVIAEHDDPRAYFRELIRTNLDVFDATSFLPPLALQWARQQGQMATALGVLEDLAEVRTMLRETETLIERLRGAVSAPVPANVFPDLRQPRERATVLRNRLSRLRMRLAASSDDGGGSPQLRQVRARRREIEQLLGRLPASDEDFVVRSDRALARFRQMGQELSQMEVEVLGLEARIVAMERYLQDIERRPAAAGRRPDPSGIQAVRTELANHRNAVNAYRERIRELRLMIERGRLQVGVGDATFRRDIRLRDEYRDLVRRERELGGGGPGDQLLRRADAVETRLGEFETRIDEVATQRAAQVRRDLAVEEQRMAGYREQLTQLETEAEEVVGQISVRDFQAVRQRFYDLVLRADVGVVDVAWARREEHRLRVETLTSERGREIQALDDEFREVMDEQSGPAPESDALEEEE